MTTYKRISLVFIATLLLVSGIRSTGMAAEADAASQINDVCANCHRTAPVPATHVRVASASVTGCLNCHKAEAGDKLLVNGHQRHLAMNMQCSTCHAGTPPQRSALDALLQASRAR